MLKSGKFFNLIYKRKKVIQGKEKFDQLEIELTHTVSEIDKSVTEFWFRPKKEVKISEVEITIESFKDLIMGDLKTIYQAGNWYLLVGYEGVECGQDWRFVFRGRTEVNISEFVNEIEYNID